MRFIWVSTYENNKNGGPLSWVVVTVEFSTSTEVNIIWLQKKDVCVLSSEFSKSMALTFDKKCK